MIYDAPCSLPGASFAHLPIYGLEDLGFVPRGEVGAFIAERNTAPGENLKLPLNANGGGLSYMHSGMYALQESVRQMRGTAPAQIPGAKISVCHGVGGMFAASERSPCRTSRRRRRSRPRRSTPRHAERAARRRLPPFPTDRRI
jgi:hypothetical protein